MSKEPQTTTKTNKRERNELFDYHIKQVIGYAIDFMLENSDSETDQFHLKLAEFEITIARTPGVNHNEI